MHAKIHRMIQVKTRIGPSKIHGIGLFAEEFIPKGTIVWRFVPGYDLELTPETVKALPGHVRQFFAHYGYLDSHLHHWMLHFDNGRFINHSDDPNTRPNYSEDPHGVDVAVRDIAAGEEITSDYTLFEIPKTM